MKSSGSASNSPKARPTRPATADWRRVRGAWSTNSTAMRRAPTSGDRGGRRRQLTRSIPMASLTISILVVAAAPATRSLCTAGSSQVSRPLHPARMYGRPRLRLPSSMVTAAGPHTRPAHCRRGLVVDPGAPQSIRTATCRHQYQFRIGGLPKCQCRRDRSHLGPVHERYAVQYRSQCRRRARRHRCRTQDDQRCQDGHLFALHRQRQGERMGAIRLAPTPSPEPARASPVRSRSMVASPPRRRRRLEPTPTRSSLL